MYPLADRESGVSVPQIVRNHRRAYRYQYGLFPLSTAQVRPPKRFTCGRGEHERRIGGIGGEVFCEDIGKYVGDRDGPSSCFGLGWTVGEVAGDFGGGAFDAECFAEEVDVVDVECRCFPGSQSGECSDVDKGAISGIYGVGEVVDFVDGEVPVFGLLHAGEWRGSCGVGWYESICDGLLEGGLGDVVSFVDGGGFVVCRDGGDPGSDGCGGEVAELCVCRGGVGSGWRCRSRSWLLWWGGGRCVSGSIG